MKVVPIVLTLVLSLNANAQSDIEMGKKLYVAPGKGGCATCHGENGNEPVMPLYPKIGGQNELYLFNQMRDYKLKKRKNGLFVPMEVAMTHYSDEEIKMIASYLASIDGFAHQ